MSYSGAQERQDPSLDRAWCDEQYSANSIWIRAPSASREKSCGCRSVSHEGDSAAEAASPHDIRSDPSLGLYPASEEYRRRRMTMGSRTEVQTNRPVSARPGQIREAQMAGRWDRRLAVKTDDHGRTCSIGGSSPWKSAYDFLSWRMAKKIFSPKVPFDH